MTDEGTLVLVRHGETAWARDGRHTGRTDVPLTERGRAQASALRPVLAQLLGPDGAGLVLASPLSRAAETARLAGLDVTPEPLLQEWDYGAYEGLTSAQIRERTGTAWTAFADGVPVGAPPSPDAPSDATPGPGESLEDVAARAKRVLERVRPVLATGRDVVLVGHGHALRVLAACWLEQPAAFAAHLPLAPACVSRLGSEHDVPALRVWNLPSPG